ncbi:hypothetical protein ACWERW_31580 [Streptomyces sp. NPDC004012]
MAWSPDPDGLPDHRPDHGPTPGHRFGPQSQAPGAYRRPQRRDLYTRGECERLGALHDEEFDLEELNSRLEAVDFTSDREYAAYGMSPH